MSERRIKAPVPLDDDTRSWALEALGNIHTLCMTPISLEDTTQAVKKLCSVVEELIRVRHV